MAILDGLDGDVFDGLWLLFFMCVFGRDLYIHYIYLYAYNTYCIYIYLYIKE